MELCLYVHTSWDYCQHSIMICGFRPPTEAFTTALDEVMGDITVSFVENLTR